MVVGQNGKNELLSLGRIEKKVFFVSFQYPEPKKKSENCWFRTKAAKFFGECPIASIKFGSLTILENDY